MLTVDGERGRRFRLAHHVLRHAGVGADVGRDESTDLQGVIFTDLVSGEQEVARIAESSKDMDKREEGGLNQGAGGVRLTSLWAGPRHLSSSVQWEPDRRGLRT